MASSNVRECGNIDLSDDLWILLDKLCMNAEHSDVTFIVGNAKIPAHKTILSARNSYFQALFRDGFAESNQSEIELKVPLDAFKMILRFIYTGYLSLTPLNVNQIIDVYALVDLYNFEPLKESIPKYLTAILSMDNCGEIMNAACLHSLDDLQNACLAFMDRRSTELIKQDTFKSISPTLLCTLLERDTFYAPEIDIFVAVKNWSISNPSADLNTPLSLIRWSLISMNEFMDIVLPSKVLSSKQLIDVAKRNREGETPRIPSIDVLICSSPEYSGENLASEKHNAETISGENASALLDGNFKNYALHYGFTYHKLNDLNCYSIIVKLGKISIINYIEMLLMDKDERSFSYYIDVSVDGITYDRLIDYSAYYCRSWQFLNFLSRPVQFIKLVGTRMMFPPKIYLTSFLICDPTYTFDVVGLKAMYIEGGGTVVGFSRPKNNVANQDIGAMIIEGGGGNNMLNLRMDEFTCHGKNNGRIILQLNQPYYISSIRMLLGCHKNYTNQYSFYIETSLDKKNWQLAVDKRDENLTEWQQFEFEERPVVFVKIAGTKADIIFICTYFECPCSPKQPKMIRP